MRLQNTIKNSTSIYGVGLHSGLNTTVTLNPAKANSGISFIRTDIKDKPIIKASIENVCETNRRTVLMNNDVSVETVEHLLSALYAYEIDNVNIDINGPEIPILDGSSKCFVELIEKAGIITQDQPKPTYHLPNYFKVENSDGSKIEYFPQEKLEIEVSIDYKSSVLLPQKHIIRDLSSFKDEIASARTFCFLHELEILTKHNLIKGGDVNNGIVFVEHDTNASDLGSLKSLIGLNHDTIKKGILNNKKLLYKNEQVRHKILDLIGDISLVNHNFVGKIVAHKPGHDINSDFAKKLNYEIKKNRINHTPLMRINEIKKILPHREPFLFIDEIIELTDNSVIGLKYIKAEEYYFKGHFPGAPVMPGVLQIEAMAQTGGILALNSVQDPENYLTYFMKIDKVKFKQKVEPNCIIIFKLNLLSPIRRGICHMEAKAYVNNNIVTQAELMAKIVKEK